MNYIKYIILGIIQGITEPLPISSSGHIFLFKNVFGGTIFNNLNFEIIANFGSFLAILFIFEKDIWKLIKNFFSYIFKKEKRLTTKDDFMYTIKIIISTIPACITGLLFNSYLENKCNLKILGISFLISALILYGSKNTKGDKTSNEITVKDAIIIGLFQAITIVPGISRSGTVLVACLLCKLKKDDALKYTFMLYFPISIGTIVLKLFDLNTMESSLLISYSLGMIMALTVTYFSYKWLSNIVKEGKLWKFSIYCLFIAFFIFIYFR